MRAARATAAVINTTTHTIEATKQAPAMVKEKAPIYAQLATGVVNEAIHSDTTAKTLAKKDEMVTSAKWKYAKAHVRTKRGVQKFINEVKSNLDK